MPGETNLARLLASLQPVLGAELYTFATVTEEQLRRLSAPLGVFREAEGPSVLLPLRDAQTLRLPCSGPLRKITLEVHSSLEAVGLTACVARALADASIPCNVVAANHHDHLFVPADRAAEAHALLTRLQQEHANGKTSPTIRFRRAVAADAGAIAALAATVWITTYCTAGIPADYAAYVLAEFTAPAIAAAIAKPDAVFWVAESTEGIVGFADLRLGARSEHLSAAQQAEVARLYVLDRFARQGIGRTLLAHCRTTAADHGATALWLSMYAGNDRARAFYLAQGWTKVGTLAFNLAGKSYPNDVFALNLPPAVA